MIEYLPIVRSSHLSIWIIILMVMAVSCSPVNQLRINHQLRQSAVFSRQFTGFCLYDPEEKKYLSCQKADLYFTPASNTKILTTLACLETFGDSIPSFLYEIHEDSLFIQPFADPTFLHPDFRQQPALEFLLHKKVHIRWINSPLEAYGPGWAWDDFQYNFQPERSWFPIYGNTMRILKVNDRIEIIPRFFEDYTRINYGEKPGDYISRDIKYNLFNVWIENEHSIFEREIPFDYDQELLGRLLSDTLHRKVLFSQTEPFTFPDTIYNQSTLNVLANMMLASDNFLAEQLLIQAALSGGQTNIDQFRRDKLREWAHFNPNPIQWYDGSGLSRYNLITPRSLVSILDRIYSRENWNTLKILFPTGGQTGTIKEWYYRDPPYVFAKTGTLKNNHSLSGYLQARSGKILIFSIMNNNHFIPTDEVKKEMEALLSRIWKMY